MTTATAIGFLRRARVLMMFYPRPASPIPQNPFTSSSEEPSFTVSHLVGSYGFSQKEAIMAAKYVRFETPEKPNEVFAFFISHGFSESQTSKIFRTCPRLLASKPQKLLPKLQFFYAKGASKPDVAKIVAVWPLIMARSLENQIIPSFNFLADFVQSEEVAMAIVKRFAGILTVNPRKCVEPNIKALRESGVAESDIAAFLRRQPPSFVASPRQFKENLEEVKRLGFDPAKATFPLAVRAMTQMSKSTWERKTDVYRRWGWSEQEIRSAFFKFPCCVMYSEARIMASMDFFVNKMGMESSSIARLPTLLSYSLEKRIIPRYSVLQALRSKGLINKDRCPASLFIYSDKMFLQKFVNCYEEEAPQLLNLLLNPQRVNLSGNPH